MTEPVGFAASIITLLDLSREVLEYIKDAYHANKEREEIFLEVTSTQDVLLQLQQKSTQEKWTDITKVLSLPQGPLQRLERALNGLVKGLKPSNSRLKTIGKALTWPFEKKEYQEILSSLERSKSLVTVALQKDLM
jgi:hypothetical protein